MGKDIQSDQLEGGVETPGSYKYYGTDGLGTEGYRDIATVLAALGYTAVSDDPYGVGWNGETDVAPSQNAVYDYIESLFPGGVVPVAGAPIAGSTFTGYTNTAGISANGNVETIYATKTSNITGTVTASFTNFSLGCTIRIRKNGVQQGAVGSGGVSRNVAVVPGDVITFTAQCPNADGFQPGTVASITFSLDYTGTFS